MIAWSFYINGTSVDEPQGFSDLVLSIKRDEEWHGIFFEAATSALQFYGTGAALLKSEKQSNGLAATATFRAEADCGTAVDIIEGSFDFGTYNEKCGNLCLVEISIEKTGCIMTLRNRYEQNVDMQKTTAFDNVTLLPVYAALDNSIQLTAQKISLGDEAQMSTVAVTTVISDDPFWVDCDGFNNYIGWIAPPLPIITNESLGTFNASAIAELAVCGSAPNHPPYPDFPNAIGTATLIGTTICDLTDTTSEFRIKGSATVVFSGAAGLGMSIKLFRLPVGLADIAINWVEEYVASLVSTLVSGTFTFDDTATVPLTINQGDFFFWAINTRGDSLNNIDSFSLTIDTETYFKLLTSATCQPTQANMSLVNEMGSRIVESITDGCLNLKSDYYGRTDSEPYTSTADGCGSLRVLSNGLKIRNATTSNHFLSLKDFFTGLRGIDNIGMGIEDNTVTNLGEWLRVEPVEYFYNSNNILTIDSVPESVERLESLMGYSTIKIGYPNWEVTKVNGLNEFNSSREFRTSLKTIKNDLDATSNFVAGGIPIEVTRQQSFAITGEADTKYDNDTFVICITRDGEYNVEFFASGNHMTFITSGTGAEFVDPTITILGSVSNDGVRAVLSYSTTALFNNHVLMDITFNGGVTIDEVAANVTFPGIVTTGYFVEKGNIDNPANIFSPTNTYNWRIRPMYNLMRWFKTIGRTYSNLVSTTSKLLFASGTGNYIAEGELLSPDSCKLESGILAENHDLYKTDFASTDYIPVLRPETLQFNYPLSIADYLSIKANPYGYILVQCGQGGYEKAYIKNIDFKVTKGEAQFTLIKKWQ